MKIYDSMQELEFESNLLIDRYLEKAFCMSMSDTPDTDDVVGQQLMTLVEDQEPDVIDFKNLMAFELRYDDLAAPFHEDVEEILTDLQMMMERMIANVHFAYGDPENRQKNPKPYREGPVPPKSFN